MIKSNEKKAHLLCNCFHSFEDHYRIPYCEEGNRQVQNLITWCRYSEYGQCPCDTYTSMTNLEYLEYLYNNKAL